MASAQSLRIASVTKPSAHPLAFRKTLIAVLQTLLVIGAYYASFLLRFDFKMDAATAHLFAVTVLIVVGIKLPVFYLFGLLREPWLFRGVVPHLHCDTRVPRLCTFDHPD